MTSVVSIGRHLGLFQEGIDCGLAFTLFFDYVVGNVSDSQGFAYVNALVLSRQADVTPQLAITKASTSNQCNRTEEQGAKEPGKTSVPLVFSCGSGKERTGKPNEDKSAEETHYQSVTAS